jgi:hypothetical protein
MLRHLLEKENRMITLRDRLRRPALRGTGFLALWTFFTLAGCGGDESDPLDETTPPQLVMQWGSKGSLDGQFDQLGEVAVDSDGNVYVADTHNRRIQKFTSDGTFLAKWGTQPVPFGIAVDSSDSVFVSISDHIEKYTKEGQFLTRWGRLGRGDGEFQGAVSIDIDATGNVYVVDFENCRIQKFTNDGRFLKKWNMQGYVPDQFAWCPTSVAVHPNGNVYVTHFGEPGNRTQRGVQVFTSEGMFVTSFRPGEARPGQDTSRYTPQALGIGSDGYVYVGLVPGRIQKFRSDGTFLIGWGGLDSDVPDVGSPSGIAVDGSGNIYVSDVTNLIFKFR